MREDDSCGHCGVSTGPGLRLLWVWAAVLKRPFPLVHIGPFSCICQSWPKLFENHFSEVKILDLSLARVQKYNDRKCELQRKKWRTDGRIDRQMDRRTNFPLELSQNEAFLA